MRASISARVGIAVGCSSAPAAAFSGLGEVFEAVLRGRPLRAESGLARFQFEEASRQLGVGHLGTPQDARPDHHQDSEQAGPEHRYQDVPERRGDRHDGDQTTTCRGWSREIPLWVV